MITYQSEQMFVQNFCKDIKNETEFSVNGKNFSAKYAGKNDSKQSIYSVTIDGENKKMNITQLKKRLGVTWTAERINSGSDNTTATKFADKTDEELVETAKKAVEKIEAALAVINKAADTYSIQADVLISGGYTNNDDVWVSSEQMILDSLKSARNRAIAERNEKAEKAEKEKQEKLQSKLKELLKLGLSKDDVLAMLG